MFKKTINSIIAILVVFIITACGTGIGKDTYKNIPTTNNLISTQKTLDELAQADEIVLKKSLLSLGDNWSVQVNGHEIAQVKGDTIMVLGDDYVMTSKNGDIIGSKSENIRFFTRGTTKYDSQAKPVGFYEQQVLSLRLNIYTLDKDKNKVGELNSEFLSFNWEGTIKDKKDKTSYTFKKEIFSIGSKITIKKVAEPEGIDTMDAIWMTMISNEIKESKSN